MKIMPAHPVVARVIRHTLAGVAIAVLPGSCGPGYIAPPVGRQILKISPAPASVLERGYIVHQAKCAKCHPFENPANYPVDKLKREIMPTMARKSKLTPADEQAVLAYLLAAREIPAVSPQSP